MFLLPMRLQFCISCQSHYTNPTNNPKEAKMKKLTEKEIIKILEKGTISEQPENVKKQVYAYAFGEEFVKSKDKGTLKQY